MPSLKLKKEKYKELYAFRKEKKERKKERKEEKDCRERFFCLRLSAGII